MPKAIRFYETGGPEVLRFEDVEVPKPGPGEAQVRHTAVGLNFIDVYDRTGLYAVTLPSGLGREAAGVVMALGRKAKGVRVGDRVAYALGTPGAASDVANVSAERLVKIPNGVSDQQAAAVMLKGLTAQYLLRRAHRVAKGEYILVLAAAGGVGLILCQWAKYLGARVIGVVGSESKAQLAQKNGCRHVLIHGRDDIVASVKKITRGEGVAVVYDSVGKELFMLSLDCIRPRGLMVSFGSSSGPVPPIALSELTRRGSLFLTRPSLFSYIAKRAELESGARELFAVVKNKKVKVHIGRTYPLAETATAHADLEARRTTGSTILIP
jgi:NADPH2:quinone reductase